MSDVRLFPFTCTVLWDTCLFTSSCRRMELNGCRGDDYRMMSAYDKTNETGKIWEKGQFGSKIDFVVYQTSWDRFFHRSVSFNRPEGQLLTIKSALESSEFLILVVCVTDKWLLLSSSPFLIFCQNHLKNIKIILPTNNI